MFSDENIEWRTISHFKTKWKTTQHIKILNGEPFLTLKQKGKLYNISISL
jgi:hypothetical protein